MDQLSRTRLLLGEEGIQRLRQANVAVFGLGGVGSYTVEALARSGIGALTLVDHDTISLTNLNRQIFATHTTIGQYKIEVAARRVADIDPEIAVTARKTFYTPETASEFDFTQFDYIVDAIDTITGKLALIQQAKLAGTPIISCMGTGNKLDPTAFRVADIHKTSGCHLARIMRKECRKREIDSLKVVYSPEEPIEPQIDPENRELPPEGRRALPGSCAFVPSVAGLIIASEVIKDIIKM